MGYIMKNANKFFTAVLTALLVSSGGFFNHEVYASDYSGWKQVKGKWYYYDNGSLLKDAWAQDTKGWCYLSAEDGSQIKSGWAKDLNGWCYLDSDGYWVNHAALAKDNLGYCIIGDDGYWTGQRQELNVMSTIQIAKNVVSVVSVEVMDSTGTVYTKASGCVAAGDGKIITNYHTIDGAASIKVILQDGTAYDIEGILGFSREKDIAVLKLKNADNLTPVIFGNSDNIQLGEHIVAIGNPGGYMGTVSEGIISGIHRLNFDLRQAEDFQISAPITNGSSGGGVFNMQGQLVGITYAGNLGAGNLNFAIPINDVKPYLLENNLTSLKNINFINP